MDEQHESLHVVNIMMGVFVQFEKFSVGEERLRVCRGKDQGVDLLAGRKKGRGLILLLPRHWWTRGTKMPVPGAGKQTDIRHRGGCSSDGI